jgi:hypothetical protein
MDFTTTLADDDDRIDDWFARGIENNPPVLRRRVVIDSSHCSGGGLARRIIQRQSSAYAVLNGRLEISLFEPKKAHRQLPKIVSFVTNRQLARSPERVGRVSLQGRCILLGRPFHDQSRGMRDGGGTALNSCKLVVCSVFDLEIQNTRRQLARRLTHQTEGPV